eukprot:1161678-Pelagomonas_calceolata.AAC.9
MKHLEQTGWLTSSPSACPATFASPSARLLSVTLLCRQTMYKWDVMHFTRAIMLHWKHGQQYKCSIAANKDDIPTCSVLVLA